MSSNNLIFVTTILYNEICYVEEWINFHIEQGANYIYLYVAYKTTPDDTIFNEIQNKYSACENIFFIHKKWTTGFLLHFNDFFLNYKDKHIDDWISILDIDEFMYSPNKIKITDILKTYEEKNIHAVLVNWLCYGSNNLIDKPPNVVNSFTKKSNIFIGINCSVKSLVKINKVQNNPCFINSHKLPLIPNCTYYTSTGIPVNEHNSKNLSNLNKIRNQYLSHMNIKNNATPIKCDTSNKNCVVYPECEPNLIINHYITRSKSEYQKKIDNNPHRKDRYNMTFFNNLNTLLDLKFNID